MKRKNRGYKRDEPHRDATLFVIACEGAVREKEYFEHLGEYSSRIRIKVLEQDGQHKSAPKWIQDSAVQYASETGLQEADQLWLVMDIDRWKIEVFHEIQHVCESQSNWSLALSNPCFEVWLYLHVDDIQKSTSTTCSDLKTELGTMIPGGYNKVRFIQRIREAHNRSVSLDTNINHFMPDEMRTKMHLLSGQLLSVIGDNAGI
jgi:hypothetical protein